MIRTCKIKIIVFTFIFLFSLTLSAIGQENQQPSEEELQAFFKQYASAFLEGDVSKTEQLIHENQEYAQIAAKRFLNYGIKVAQTEGYEKALPIFTFTLKNFRQLGDRQREAEALHFIGVIYQYRGDYQQALDYYQNSLKINRKIGNKDGEVDTLHNIGVTYQRMGKLQEALNYLQETLEIDKKSNNLSGILSDLTAIGAIYRQISEYQQALNYFQKAIKIAEERGDNPQIGFIARSIGKIYRFTSQHEQALSYFQKALLIFREINDIEGQLITLNDMGPVYIVMGKYQQALKYLYQALHISRKNGNIAEEANALNNIGMVHEITGEYRKALSYLQEALKIWNMKKFEDKEDQGTMLHNIGLLFRRLGEYQQALFYYQASLEISKNIADKFGEGRALNSIGIIYQLTGDYEQALSYFQEALQIERQIGNISIEGRVLNNIGDTYLRSYKNQEALNYLQEALKINRKSGDRDAEWGILQNIGVLYEREGKWVEALQRYKEAVEIFEKVRMAFGSQEMKEASMEQNVYFYRHIISLLLERGFLRRAFTYMERSKSKSFLEQLYEVSTGMNYGVDPKLLEEETTLYNKLFVIEQHLKQPLPDEQREQLWEERHSLEHELSVLQLKFRTSNPRYAELKYPQPVTVEQIQQEILKEDEVIIEYLQGDEELYVFIIGKNSFSTHTIEIGKKDLSNNIEKFLKLLRSASHEKLNHELANQLYQLLFQPLEQKVVDANSGKDIQHLIIVPDGVLFYLPFEMLVTQDGKTPEYLVDRYSISYSPSASVLKPEILHVRQPDQYMQDLLALAPFGEGNPEITQVALRSTENLLLSDTLRSGLEGVQPLPYSAGEVQTISSLYPQSVCKIGADATKAFFKEHANGNRYLHLSTHGYLDNEHAMYSGLLFSDGMLQTYEIFNLDIDAELTVLSACQTGLGELKAGEGLVGLTRAFMYAGSPSLLVSLWPVSDPSTAAFMKCFYRNLNRGMTKAEALRETKIWMKEKSYHTDEHGNVIKHDNPFYWAPFILVGDWK